MPATVEELQGLIAGLSEVVKVLTTNLNTVATQVGAITTSADTNAQHPNQVEPELAPQNPQLLLTTLQLPTSRQDIAAQDDISYFFERFQEQTAYLTTYVQDCRLSQNLLAILGNNFNKICLKRTACINVQQKSHE